MTNPSPAEGSVMVDCRGGVLAEDSRVLARWGLGWGDARTRTVWELLPPTLTEKDRLGLAQALAEGSPWSILLSERDAFLSVNVLPAADGRRLVVARRLMAAIGSELGQSIRHRDAEREVRKSERRLAAVLESAMDAVISMDRNGRIVDYNRAAESIFGNPRDQAVGRLLGDLIIPERYRDAHRAGLSRFLDSGQGPILNRRIELSALRADGEEFPAELTVTHTLLEEGENLFTGYLRDITQRLQMQRELEAARDEALRANRTKTLFLANTSHEIRTPISGIVGMLEFLEETGLSSEQKDHVETIRHCSRSLLSIIDEILDLSRIESGNLSLKPVPFALEGAARRAADLLAPQAQEKGLCLGVEIGEVPEWVLGDPCRIHQILVNLISNAIKYTDFGSVTVGVFPGPPGRVRFQVVDTGRGIRSEEEPRLFSPFTQLDDSVLRRAGGTGLGLSIVKRLVGLMGGEVGVSSTYGSGSTFWFELPLGAVPPPAVRRSSQREPALSAGLRVLIAEDNPINRRVLVLQLEKLGIRPDSVKDGEELLERVQKQDYDLILMDCQMPRVDGYEAARRIRESSLPVRDIPIVAVTAHAMPGEELKCLDAGMNDYLSKPIDWNELRRVLERWGRSTR